MSALTTVEECAPGVYYAENMCPFFVTAIAVTNIVSKTADIEFTLNDAVPAGAEIYWRAHAPGSTLSARELRVGSSNMVATNGTATVTTSVSDLPEGNLEVSAIVFWANRDSLDSQIATSAGFTIAGAALPTCTPAEFAAATSGTSLMNLGTVSTYRTRALPPGLIGLPAARQTEIVETGVVSLDDYGVIRDGVTDQAAVCQLAFDDARDFFLALDLGSGSQGIIALSRALVATRYNNTNATCVGGSNPNSNFVAKGNPNDYPIFRLMDTPDPINDWNNPNDRRSVIYLFSDIGPNCTKDDVPGTPEDVPVNGLVYENTGANGFHQTLSYVEIRTGGGGNKLGCSGLYADGAQHASIQGIRVVSEAGTPIFAGIERLPGRLGGGFEIELVPHGDMQFGWHGSGRLAQPILGDFVVSPATGNITDAIFVCDSRTPITVTHADLSFDATVTKVWRTLDEEFPFSSSGSSAGFLHSIFRLTGNSATTGNALFSNTWDGGRDLVLRDVYVTGAGVGRPLFDHNGAVENFTASNQYIERHEFIQKDVLGAQIGNGTKIRFATHPATRFDPVTGAEDKATVTVMNAGAAPAGFLTQGRFASTNEPSLYDANVFDCLYNGCLNNRGAVDVAPQLNAIIQQWGETHSIFLPAGNYFIGSPIMLTPNTRLFGAGMTFTNIVALDTWDTSTERHIIETPDDADGSAWLHEMSLVHGDLSDGATRKIGFTHWRIGRNSRVSRVAANEGNKNLGVPSTYHLFSGNGGGMWRVSGALDHSMSKDPDSYYLRWDATTQPFTAWGVNPEHRENNQRWLHAVDSSNIHLLGIKTESQKRYGFFQNCDNVRICGFGVGSTISGGAFQTAAVFLYEECSNIEFLLYNGNLFSNPNNGFANPIVQFVNGGVTVSSSPLTNVNNAELGNFDPSVFVHE